jgi:hypothetical protein
MPQSEVTMPSAHVAFCGVVFNDLPGVGDSEIKAYCTPRTPHAI